ncbi:hypothetical protein HXY33_08070 [Candidatus Bathyarchaeota archaeon]|nr:hypothetical protein [Candidatus Bathyarchaeota archaeon]
MAAQTPTKRLVIRWTTMKGLAAIILFLLIAALIEYVIVLYAMNLGVRDTSALQWTSQFLTITISPLFHLVPITVITTLLFIWTYLTRHLAIKPYEAGKRKVGTVSKRGKEPGVKKFFGKVKSGLLHVRSIAYLWQRIHFARATIKSALTVLLAFGTFILIISLIAFPRLIPRTVADLYQNNPALFDFMKNVSATLAPVGSIFTGMNNALLSAAPGFRNVVSGLGNILRPLTNLDNAGKYLAFQNAAAWIAALAVLFYGEFRKSYRYRKGKS